MMLDRGERALCCCLFSTHGKCHAMFDDVVTDHLIGRDQLDCSSVRTKRCAFIVDFIRAND